MVWIYDAVSGYLLKLLVLLALAASPSAALAQSASDAISGRNPVAQTSNGCPTTHPLYCTPTDCCPSDTPYFCNSLQRNHPSGAAPAGWSGCARPSTAESLKWWADSCQPVWVRCS